MSRLKLYTGPTSTRRSLCLKLPPTVQRFCQYVWSGLCRVAEPYLGFMCIVIL